MRIRQRIGNIKRKCGNCKYWDDFSGVCFCVGSDKAADFTGREFVCKWHEYKDGDMSEDKTTCGEC